MREILLGFLIHQGLGPRRLYTFQDRILHRKIGDFTDSYLSCIFGSGTKAGVIEINGQYPAAPIQVTEGALVHVKVNNNLFGAVAPTLHWHGFKMSNGYYWYVMPGRKSERSCAKVDASTSMIWSVRKNHIIKWTVQNSLPQTVYLWFFGPPSRAFKGTL